MTALQKYTRLKKRVDEAQQAADKAEGALGQVMKQLKADFGCSTLKEAERKLKALGKQEAAAKKDFDEAVEEFEENWPDESD